MRVLLGLLLNSILSTPFALQQVEPIRPSVLLEAEGEPAINEHANTLSPDESYDLLPSFGEDFDENEVDEEIYVSFFMARELILKGDWQSGKKLLEDKRNKYPDSRHLHQLLAEAYWREYKDLSGGERSLAVASNEAVKGLELGLTYGKVDHRLMEIAAESLGTTGKAELLDRLFAEIIKRDDSMEVHLSYAKSLSLLEDARAGAQFNYAIATAPSGNNSALESYLEWLIAQGSYKDILSLTSHVGDKSRFGYIHFLRGLAFENLGHTREALAEYNKYSKFSAIYPAPSRFNTLLQGKAGIRVESEGDTTGEETKVRKTIDDEQAIKGLSFLINGEAGGESLGGQRAIGWVVRNRVNRGTVYDPRGRACPSVKNYGVLLGDAYKSVMCQGRGSQFNGVCLAWCTNPSTRTCNEGSTTRDAAWEVFNGFAPDPVGEHCPGGMVSWGGDWCSEETECIGGTHSYTVAGGVFNFGTTKSCPPKCAISKGKVCGDGNGLGQPGRDNCFYATLAYARRAVLYKGNIPDNSCITTSPFQAHSGLHKAHFEGVEGLPYRAFDLELQEHIKTEDQDFWDFLDTTVPTETGSVQDFQYVGNVGEYRYLICTANVRGGPFTLYTIQP